MKRALWILGIALVVAGAVFAVSFSLGSHARAAGLPCDGDFQCGSPDICYFPDTTQSYCALPVGSPTCNYGCCSNADCPGTVCSNPGTPFSFCAPETPSSNNNSTAAVQGTSAAVETSGSSAVINSSSADEDTAGGSGSSLCITATAPTTNSNASGFYTQIENACQQEFGSTWAQCVADAGPNGPTTCNYGTGNAALAFSCGMPESAGNTTGACLKGGSSNCITPLTSAQMAAQLANVSCPASETTAIPPAPSSIVNIAAGCVSDPTPPTPLASSDTSASDLSQYVAAACASSYQPEAARCESDVATTGAPGADCYYTNPQLAYDCGEPYVEQDGSYDTVAGLVTSSTYPILTTAQMATQFESGGSSGYDPSTGGEVFVSNLIANYVRAGCTELWTGSNPANGNYVAEGENPTNVYADPQLAYNCDEPGIGTGDYPTMTYAQMAAAFEALSCSGTGANGSGAPVGTNTTSGGSSTSSPESTASYIAAQLTPIANFLSSLSGSLSTGAVSAGTTGSTSSNSSMQMLCSSLGY